MQPFQDFECCREKSYIKYYFINKMFYGGYEKKIQCAVGEYTSFTELSQHPRKISMRMFRYCNVDRKYNIKKKTNPCTGRACEEIRR